MVSAISKKSKYSYAERVLHAVSLIQRDHRKHSVHIATIRAQDRKDKLGPQWSSWVTRTLKKFEEQGVLSIDGANNVTFTSDAKKAFTSVRRETVDALPTDDVVIKSVAHQLTSGVKRKRRFSVPQPRLSISDDEGENEYDSISARRPVSKKSRRRSIAAAPRTAKKRIHEPTDDEQAEIARLQAEVQSLRHQLAVSRLERTATPELTEDLNSTSTPREVTPPAQVPPPISQRPLPGATRTQSGSMIDQYSKQPTPAPTSPGAMEHEHDEFDMVPPLPDIAEDYNPRRNISDASHGLATPPPSSPMEFEDSSHRPTGQELDASRANLRGTISELESEIAKLERVLSEKRAQLAVQDTDIVAEKARAQSLQISVIKLQDLLNARETALAKAEETIKESDSALSAAHCVASELKRQLKAVHEQLLTLQTERDKVLARADVSATDLAKEKDAHSRALRENQELKDKLSAAEDAASSLRTEVDAEKVVASSLESQCHAMEDRCQVAERQSAEAHERLSDLTSQLKTLEESSELGRERAVAVQEALIAELTLVNSALEESKAAEAKLRDEFTRMLADRDEEISTLRGSISSLEEQLSASNQIIERLTQKLHSVSEQEQALAADLLTRDTTITELQASRDDALTQISSLSTELSKNKIELADVELALDETRFRLEKTEGEFDGLRDDLLTEKDVHVALEDQLSSVHSENEQLRVELSGKTGQLETLQADLVAMHEKEVALRNKLQELERQHSSEISDRDVKLASLQASFRSVEDSLRDTLEQLQAMQNDKESLSSQLHAARDEVAMLRSTVDSQSALVASLERDLEVVSTRARGAEEEIEELHKAKTHHEATIAAIRESYSRLRQVQLDTLAELDDKVASINSSFMPHARSSVVSRAAAPTQS
ncbi:unnamed protein product [Somion occarium]|uniref:Uncharacterized protein n=1 Tax=Somion occarium TaxID=3059160 RepID=A0ABP1CVW6_9APHY